MTVRNLSCLFPICAITRMTSVFAWPMDQLLRSADSEVNHLVVVAWACINSPSPHRINSNQCSLRRSALRSLSTSSALGLDIPSFEVYRSCRSFVLSFDVGRRTDVDASISPAFLEWWQSSQGQDSAIVKDTHIGFISAMLPERTNDTLGASELRRLQKAIQKLLTLPERHRLAMTSRNWMKIYTKLRRRSSNIRWRSAGASETRKDRIQVDFTGYGSRWIIHIHVFL